jgi:hypothetical protein
MNSATLEIVETVTREHAEAFAEVFLDRAFGTEAIMDAFAEVRLVTWPLTDAHAQALYNLVADAVVEATFAMAKPAIADAFLMAATVILAREREAQGRANTHWPGAPPPADQRSQT